MWITHKLSKQVLIKIVHFLLGHTPIGFSLSRCHLTLLSLLSYLIFLFFLFPFPSFSWIFFFFCWSCWQGHSCKVGLEGIISMIMSKEYSDFYYIFKGIFWNWEIRHLMKFHFFFFLKFCWVEGGSLLTWEISRLVSNEMSCFPFHNHKPLTIIIFQITFGFVKEIT